MNGRQKKTLVTGGNGFVGRWLVDALVERGDDVTVFDVQEAGARADVRYIKGDLRDQDGVRAACAGQEAVFHNASVVHTRNNRVRDVWDVNLGGTQHVLAGCREHGVGRLIYVSSASAVYEGRDVLNGDETLPYSGVSQAPYADSKIAAEKLILASSDDSLATLAIRPHVVFGPGDQRFVPAIVERARRGKLKFTVGLKRKLSDFTYISNLVDALLAADERLKPGTDVAGQAYFVTNGEPIAFWDFVEQLLEEMAYPKPKRAVPYAVAYAVAAVAEAIDTLRGGSLGSENGLSRFAVRYMCTHHYFSIDKARRDLGYEPAVNLTEGIARTARHLRESKAAGSERTSA